MSFPAISQYILIIAGSGRMAAQAAYHVGLKSLVIDVFSDLDTRRYAEAFYQIPSLSITHLVAAVDFFTERYSVKYMLYGSGFEYYPESLYYLNGRLILLGNTADTFARLQNKADFFTTLSNLGIPYPKVSFKAPGVGRWLVKPMQGQGGAGIRHYHTEHPQQAVYWQQYQQGVPQSVLFLADRQTAQLIGFNTQWTVKTDAGEAFIFSGIINSSALSVHQKTLISGWLAKLVQAFGLNGLNSMDFIQNGKDIYVLEINPRLSASMQLYDSGLLIQHIHACQGDMSSDCIKQTGYTGYQIIYAGQDVVIPDAFEWPEDCMDLPPAGVNCRKGQPICSIIARHKTVQHVLEQLQRKQLSIFKQLQTGSSSWNTQQVSINFPSL